MATPGTPFVPILDVRAALEHAFIVADEACYLVAPHPNGPVSPHIYGFTFQLPNIKVTHFAIFAF